MSRFFTGFISQLLVIGMVINIRTDIPFWKQFVGYVIIACLLPFAEFLEDRKIKE